MYHLAIDTCVWIDLCRRYPYVLSTIAELIDQNKAILVLPVVVIEEWQRNKSDRIIEEERKSIQGKIKNAKELSELLESDDAKEFDELLAKANPEK